MNKTVAGEVAHQALELIGCCAGEGGNKLHLRTNIAVPANALKECQDRGVEKIVTLRKEFGDKRCDVISCNQFSSLCVGRLFDSTSEPDCVPG